MIKTTGSLLADTRCADEVNGEGEVGKVRTKAAAEADARESD